MSRAREGPATEQGGWETRSLMMRTLKIREVGGEGVSGSAGTPRERERDDEVFVLTGRQLAVAGKVKSSLLLPF